MKKENRQFKIGVVQMDIQIKEKNKNLDKMKTYVKRAADEGVQFLVFPECALTGYCYESKEEARTVAETIPGPATSLIQEMCNKFNMTIIFGLIEMDNDKVFNSAAIVDSTGVIAKHRKIHLPHLALDHYVDRGDLPISVHSTKLCSVGINICYDMMFPEIPRIQAIKGADLIAIPTNWPEGARSPELVSLRAVENRVYCVAANRIGSERGYTFMGTSLICDPNGKVLAKASSDKEEILITTVDPKISRNKRIEKGPNFWMDFMEDRRPEMYGDILKDYLEE